jgi:superfamily II DNA or RNA helicase
MSITLHPHQDDLICRTRINGFRAGYRRVLTQSPTGSGKGTMLAFQVHRLASRGIRVLALAHRKELVADLAGRIGGAGVEHGLIVPRAWAPFQPELRVQVGSVDTLGLRLGSIAPPDWLIIDEAHHLVEGNKWGRVVEAWPNAWLWGLTATPERLDGRGLGVGYGGYFEHLEIGPSVEWLVDRGFLARPHCYSTPSADLDDIRNPDTLAGQRRQAEMLATRQVMGDVVSQYRKRVAAHFNGTCITFAPSVERAEAYAIAFRDAGIPAAAVHGQTPLGERAAMFRDLGDASLKVLVNCELITEGVDVPGVAAVQLVRRTDSLSLYLQMLGRGLRAADGKSHAVLLDHCGNMRQPGFGSPLRDRQWSLQGRSARPRETLPAGKGCPRCDAFLPGQPKTCPECGHEFRIWSRPVGHIDGDLEFVDPRMEALREQERRRQERRELIRACDGSLDALQELGRMLGYKPGWAWTQHDLPCWQRKRASRTTAA